MVVDDGFRGVPEAEGRNGSIFTSEIWMCLIDASLSVP